MPVPPAAVTSSAVSSIVSGRSYSERWSRVLRPVQYTVAPASPSATAIPRPAPRVAPATSATLPSSVGAIRATLRARALACARPTPTLDEVQFAPDDSTSEPSFDIRREDVGDLPVVVVVGDVDMGTSAILTAELLAVPVAEPVVL